jgi:RNA polymerase subunit RPABC4/transcription elongation factor Spt4
MDLGLTLGISISIVVIVIIIYLLFPRIRGLHYTSRLTCPKCGKQFNYEWVPGGSFSAVRLGNKRYLQCPNCHQWSTFEVWDNRIEETEMNQKAPEEATHIGS